MISNRLRLGSLGIGGRGLLGTATWIESVAATGLCLQELKFFRNLNCSLVNDVGLDRIERKQAEMLRNHRRNSRLQTEVNRLCQRKVADNVLFRKILPPAVYRQHRNARTKFLEFLY